MRLLGVAEDTEGRLREGLWQPLMGTAPKIKGLKMITAKGPSDAKGELCAFGLRNPRALPFLEGILGLVLYVGVALAPSQSSSKQWASLPLCVQGPRKFCPKHVTCVKAPQLQAHRRSLTHVSAPFGLSIALDLLF